MGDGNDGLIALHIPGGKGKLCTLSHLYLLVFEGFDAVLGALGIQHNGNGHIQLFPNLFNQFDLCLMLRVRTVGEVQSRHIHTGLDHLSQSLLVAACRADGADNFGFAHLGSPWGNRL